MKYLYINIATFLIGGLFLGSILLGCDSGRSPLQAQEKGRQTPSTVPSTPAAQVTPSELFQRAGLSYMGSKGILAPDFSVRSMDGKPIKLSDFRGKVVFLNFWATWCPPCRAEMPSMETLHQRYKNQAFQILAVSVQEEPSVVKTFLSQNSFTFTIALDSKGEASQLYGIRGIPATFIIDQKGTLQGALVGGKDWSTSNVFSLIDALLKN